MSTYTWALTRRGETYRLIKRYEDALADFDHTIALDSTYTWAINRRGEIYHLMERYEDALADFDRAIALDENDWARYKRAYIYFILGQPEAFHRDLQTAITILIQARGSFDTRP